MIRRLRLGSTVAALAIALAWPASGADADELVYREVFSNNVPTNNLSFVDWQAHEGSGGTKIGGTGGGTTVHLASDGGASPNPPPLNSGPAPFATGRTFHGGTGGAAQLTWTNEFTIDGDQFVLSRVNWFENHSPGGGPLQLAVQVNGGNWFVTDQGGTPTSTSLSGWDQQTIDLTAATWQSLDFTPGSMLAVAGPAGLDLPSGDITAFGLFEDSFTANLRVDVFELFGVEPPPEVPEPSTLAMWLFGATLLGAVFYRRRLQRQIAG